MGRYALRRILLIFPTLFIASLLVAGMVHLLPGDVITALVGGRGGAKVQSEETKELFKAKLGLDKPFLCLGIKCFWTDSQYIRWVLGYSKKEGTVFKTSDGGATWRRLGVETVEPVRHLTFVTTTLGWGLGERRIFGTREGGSQWSAQHKADHPLNALFFLDEKNGWVVGDKGTIIHTTGGGVRQLTEENRSASGWVSQESGITERLTDITFVDAENGWVVGEGGVILHTVNGGASWGVQASNTEADLSSLAFSDPRNGWAVGEGGTILSTSDGGLTWSRIDSGTDEYLHDVGFTDALHVWAVGEKGTVLYSSDGGLSWVPRTIYEDMKQELTAVAFGDEFNGMIAGKHGTVLSTTDGGATWSKQEIVYTRRKDDTTVQEGPITKPISDVALFVSSSGTVRAWAPAVETRWRWGVVGGNLGKRFTLGGRPVSGEILRTLAPSIQLMIMSTFFALAFAIPIGIFSALRQDTWGDYLGRTLAIGGLAIPTFWLGTMVILIPAFYFGWVPKLIYVPFFEDPRANLYFFMLPALVAGVPAMAEIMRMTRSMMLETLRQDYIRTAWAKGLRERSVIIRHALKNAMIPVITLIGILVPYQLSQLVIVERIFNIPGIGNLVWLAIEKRDFPLIQGVALFLGVVVIVSNLIVDLIYSWLDPRIRYD